MKVVGEKNAPPSEEEAEKEECLFRHFSHSHFAARGSSQMLYRHKKATIFFFFLILEQDESNGE